MKALIITPLYPPDIEESAVYAKELAHRLSKIKSVSVLTYGTKVESLENVASHVIPKYKPLPLRLINATWWLVTNLGSFDRVLLINGPSVELPFAIANMFARRPYDYIISDSRAHAHALSSSTRSFLVRALHKNAVRVITEIPEKRPEYIPWYSVPVDTAPFEKSWQEHLKILAHI